MLLWAGFSYTTLPYTLNAWLTESRSETFALQNDSLAQLGYENCSVEGKEIYPILLQGLRNMDEVIQLPDLTTSELINEVLPMVRADHPEIFWLEGEGKISWKEIQGYGNTAVTFRPVYSYTVSEKNIIEKQIQSICQEWIDAMDSSISTFQKVRYLYNYIVQNTKYDLDSNHNQTIDSVFLNQSSVCSGYARSFQYLCHLLGIRCEYITGIYNPTQETHAWNIVYIDDKPTYLDVTMADTDFPSSNGISMIDYSSFCISTEQLLENYSIDDEFKVPECYQVN